MRCRVLYETAYRAVWVTRSRPGVFVSESPSRCSCRLRLPDTFMSGSSSRALGPSSRVSRVTAGPMLSTGRLPWAFVPHRGIVLRSPPGTGFPGPHRSVLDVSHVLDGFLLHETSRVCFTPQPRPGFHSSGVSPGEKPYGLVARRCPPVVVACPLLFSFPMSSRFTRPPSGPCSARQSVAARSGLGRALLAPLLSFPSLGFFFAHRRSDLHRSFRPRPSTAPVVLPMRDLTCSCEPVSPVRGSRPATPPRLAPWLRHEAASTKRSASTAQPPYA